jgi:hypothetical protein
MKVSPASVTAGAIASTRPASHEHHCPPTEMTGEHLRNRRRQEGAERSRGRDEAQYQAAHRRWYRARANRQRHARGRGGQGDADEYAGAEDDAEHAARARQHQKASHVEDRTREHDRTKSHPYRQRAGKRLQEPPAQVLYGHRQREVRNGDGDVTGHRLHDEAEALAPPCSGSAWSRHPAGSALPGACS